MPKPCTHKGTTILFNTMLHKVPVFGCFSARFIYRLNPIKKEEFDFITSIPKPEEPENCDHLSIMEMVKILKEELNPVSKEEIMESKNIDQAETRLEQELNTPKEIEKRGFRIPKAAVVAVAASLIVIGGIAAKYLFKDKPVKEKAQTEQNDFWDQVDKDLDKKETELKKRNKELDERKKKADDDFAKALKNAAASN